MKIELLIHSVVTKSKSRKCKLVVKIGDEYEFESAEQVSINGIYAFLEKNEIQIKQRDFEYFSLELISDNKILANKTLFISEAMNMNSLKLQALNTKDDYTVNFKLNATSIDTDETVGQIRLRRTNSIEEEPPHLSSQEGKVKFFKLGVLVYNFANKLDPIVLVSHELVSILKWEQPEQTLALGCILTFLIIFPKLSLCLLSIALLFGKNRIFKRLRQYQIQKDISTRLLFPEENMAFLQNSMQMYCDIFDVVNKFLRQDDKSSIITTVGILCKCAAFLVILQIFFTMDHLVLMSIWALLIAFSPTGFKLFKFAKPKVLQINSFIDEMTRKISKGPFGGMFKMEGLTVNIKKQFYIYEYQRWWVGKEWVPSHWSDEDRRIVLLARTEPPKNWHWMENWKIQYGSNSDQNGFEYSNDLMPAYTASKSLKTIRRRKWTRKCSRTLNFESETKAHDNENEPFSLPSLPSRPNVHSDWKEEMKGEMKGEMKKSK